MSEQSATAGVVTSHLDREGVPRAWEVVVIEDEVGEATGLRLLEPSHLVLVVVEEDEAALGHEAQPSPVYLRKVHERAAAELDDPLLGAVRQRWSCWRR